MLSLILSLTFRGFEGFATSYGAYGYGINFNIFNKPNYTLNFGISSITYVNKSTNFLKFDFQYNKSLFSIQIIGNFPINYNFNYVPGIR